MLGLADSIVGVAVKALTAKYEGEIAIATANIEVYLNNPVGIGEHSNIVQEVDKLIGIIAENEEKIRVIDETSFLTKNDNNFNFNFQPSQMSEPLIQDFEE